MSFALFHRYWNSSRWEKLTVCCPQGYQSHIIPNQKVDDTDSWLLHYQPVRRVSMCWLCTHKHIPTLSLKTYPWKSLGSSNLLSTNYIDSLLSACNKYCTLLYTTQCEDWLYCKQSSWPKFGLVVPASEATPGKANSWKVSIDSPPCQVFWWRVVWAAHHTSH